MVVLKEIPTEAEEIESKHHHLFLILSSLCFDNSKRLYELWTEMNNKRKKGESEDNVTIKQHNQLFKLLLPC